MKCSDLQIGDWVIPYIFDTASKPSKIVGISYNSYRGKDYVDWVDCEVWDELSIDDIKPIPLTSEILERNGFELRNGFFYHRIDDKPHHYDFKLKNGGVFTSEGYTLECGIYHLTIRYVHELQHALRLCGLNDLAGNFKIEE